MEEQFGHNFGRVRVHADAEAADSAAAVNASAYTVGSDLVFAQGKYAPGSPAGEKLLAHELTHVVQQGRTPAGAPNALEVSQPGDPAELQAEAFANAIIVQHWPAGMRGEAEDSGSRPALGARPFRDDGAGVPAASATPTPHRSRDATDATMQPRFGHDFSRTRVHSDTRHSTGLPLIQRAPVPDEPAKGCNIKNPRAYLYFELPRRFVNRDDNDPEVVRRATCLKRAFAQLGPDDAIYFAQMIIKKDHKNPMYVAYENLATATRKAIAEILVDVINQKTTAAYLARLLFASAATAYDDPKTHRPAIVTARQRGDTMVVTLDTDVYAVAAASVFGPSECEKYTLGFTQFVTDENFVAEYRRPSADTYFIVDFGAEVHPSLPCQDVFNKGDVWSYSTRLDCATKDVVKTVPKDPPLEFSDKPKIPSLLQLGASIGNLNALTWTDKFITILSIMLPNGAVHHVSWFTWSIEYCEHDPQKTIGKPAAKASNRKFTISDIQAGDPPSIYSERVGKPATSTCTAIARASFGNALTKESFVTDSPLIKCN